MNPAECYPKPSRTLRSGKYLTSKVKCYNKISNIIFPIVQKYACHRYFTVPLMHCLDFYTLTIPLFHVFILFFPLKTHNDFHF